MTEQTPQVFISYQRTDGEFARLVREHLVAHGVRTWMDQYDIPVGAYWPDEIDKGLRDSDILVGILSPDSVDSRNVKNEWDWALTHSKVLLLLQVRPCDIPHRYVSINYLNATGPDPADALTALTRTLGIAVVAPPGPAPAHQAPVAGAHDVPVLRHPGLVVGREREQQSLQRQLGDVLDGQGSLLLIAGEAGIGKTTLTRWLAVDAAARGGLVLAGGCYDLLTTPPYGPWLEAFTSYHPTGDLPPTPTMLSSPQALARAESQAQIFGAVREFLSGIAHQRPLLLLLEDLHWADQASLELLRAVARSVVSTRLLLLVTYRADELTRRHQLHQLLPLLVRESSAVRVDLKRLTTPALEELLVENYQLAGSDLDRMSAYLQQRTDGNPFFAGELLRALEDEGIVTHGADGWQVGDLTHVPVPALVRQVIDGRLAHLADGTRRLLQAASVVGQVVPLNLWQHVGDITDEQLDSAAEEAVQARLLEQAPQGVGFRFPHALIREALYESILLTRRRGLHRRAAEALLLHARPDPDIVADHFTRASDARAAGWLLAAGERALALHSPHAAIERLTRALELPGQLDSAEDLRAYRSRANAFETVGAFDAALADHETALEQARAVGDQRAEWQSQLDLGMLWAARDYTYTGEYYHQALELARTAGDRAMIARTLNFIGNWQVNQLRPIEGRRNHDEALAIFESIGDRPSSAETLDFLGMAALIAGDLPASYAFSAQAIALFRELDQRHGLASALLNGALAGSGAIGIDVFGSVTTLPEGLQRAEVALGVAREIDWRAGETHALQAMSHILRCHGHYGAALAAARDAREIAEAIGHQQWMILADWALGQIYLDLFAPEDARRLFDAALTRARHIHSPYLVGAMSAHLSATLIEMGQHVSARDRLAEFTGTTHVPASFDMVTVWCWTVRAKLALATGEPLAALEIVDALAFHAFTVLANRPPVRLGLIRGQALGALGRAGEAEGVLRAAVEHATADGRWSIVWRLQHALGRLYASQGRTPDAERELAAAQRVIERLVASLPEGELRETFRTQAAKRLSVA